MKRSALREWFLAQGLSYCTHVHVGHACTGKDREGYILSKWEVKFLHTAQTFTQTPSHRLKHTQTHTYPRQSLPTAPHPTSTSLFNLFCVSL